MNFRFQDIVPYLGTMLAGLGLNFLVATLSLIVGILVGLVTYSAQKSKMKPISAVASAYIELIRNTPLLVQLYIIYFGIAQIGISVSPFGSTMIAMIFNCGAYMAEILRAGFQSIKPGVIEAGEALGMTPFQNFYLIQLKPALRSAFPAIINQYILMFLGSTVSSAISMPELLYRTLHIESTTARTVEVFLITGVLFYISSFLIINVLRLMERKVFKW